MYREYLIGKKRDIESIIALLNKRSSEVQFRFEPASGAESTYFLVKETAEFDDYAMLVERKGKLYAVSRDVFRFVYDLFYDVLEDS